MFVVSVDGERFDVFVLLGCYLGVEDGVCSEVVCDGNEMVLAVVVVCVSVVSVTSMRVEVLWWESYLVGVVIVVCRLFFDEEVVEAWCEF